MNFFICFPNFLRLLLNQFSLYKQSITFNIKSPFPVHPKGNFFCSGNASSHLRELSSWRKCVLFWLAKRSRSTPLRARALGIYIQKTKVYHITLTNHGSTSSPECLLLFLLVGAASRFCEIWNITWCFVKGWGNFTGNLMKEENV